MNFLADEDVDFPVVHRLRSDGMKCYLWQKWTLASTMRG